MVMIVLVVFFLFVLPVSLILAYTFRQFRKLPDLTPKQYLQQSSKELRRVVVLLGDSITHGRIGVNYVDMLKDRLGDEEFIFINAGINSELAWNNLQRIDDVVRCEPDIVTVLVGTNDANAAMAEKTMKSYIRRMKLPRKPDIEWYRESLIAIITKLQSATNAKVALLSIPPIGENPSNLVFEKSTEYSKVVRDVATEYDVTYLPLHENMVDYLRENELTAAYPYEGYYVGIIKTIMSHYLLRRSWDDIAKRSGFSLHVDYLHLNTHGAQMVADLIFEFIRSIQT
ncbi:MAG: SGNH/GDSL hydrolase family protein [Candidatus Thorarchaeota archaeon]